MRFSNSSAWTYTSNIITLYKENDEVYTIYRSMYGIGMRNDRLTEVGMLNFRYSKIETFSNITNITELDLSYTKSSISIIFDISRIDKGA